VNLNLEALELSFDLVGGVIEVNIHPALPIVTPCLLAAPPVEQR
jgi:hypothetical protein